MSLSWRFWYPHKKNGIHVEFQMMLPRKIMLYQNKCSNDWSKTSCLMSLHLNKHILDLSDKWTVSGLQILDWWEAKTLLLSCRISASCHLIWENNEPYSGCSSLNYGLEFVADKFIGFHYWFFFYYTYILIDFSKCQYKLNFLENENIT